MNNSIKKIKIENAISLNYEIKEKANFKIEKVVYEDFKKDFKKDFVWHREQNILIYFLNGNAELVVEDVGTNEESKESITIDSTNRIAILIPNKTAYSFKVLSDSASVLFYYENNDSNSDKVEIPASEDILGDLFEPYIEQQEQKTMLVCGGAGFIGSNFIIYMMEKHKNYKIINYDKLTYAANLDNLNSVQIEPRYKFIKGDICNYDLLDEVIKKNNIDYIVNFAAETHVDRSIFGFAKEFVLSNVLGTQTLLEITKNNKQIKRFVQISTDEVFGALELEDDNKFTEETKFSPNSPYSAAKAGGDLLCRAYFKTYNVPVVVTHCSNNYGPYQFPEKIIPFFTLRLLDNKKIPVYGDGLNVRDWIHTIDHASAVDLLLDKGALGETYNIGVDNEINNITLIKMILKIMNKDESFIEYVKDRPAHDRKYAINSNKILNLGWRPIYTKENFEKGLKETVEWYINNKEWTESILSKKADELNTCVK